MGKNVFERMQSGELVQFSDPQFADVSKSGYSHYGIAG